MADVRLGLASCSFCSFFTGLAEELPGRMHQRVDAPAGSDSGLSRGSSQWRNTQLPTVSDASAATSVRAVTAEARCLDSSTSARIHGATTGHPMALNQQQISDRQPCCAAHSS